MCIKSLLKIFKQYIIHDELQGLIAGTVILNCTLTLFQMNTSDSEEKTYHDKVKTSWGIGLICGCAIENLSTKNRIIFANNVNYGGILEFITRKHLV